MNGQSAYRGEPWGGKTSSRGKHKRCQLEHSRASTAVLQSMRRPAAQGFHGSGTSARWRDEDGFAAIRAAAL